MDDPTTPRDRTEGASPADDRARALSPLPDEPRQAPPVDIDERDGQHAGTEAIPLPDHGGSQADDLGNQIEDTLPAPAGPAGPHEPAPRDDLDDQIDETLPAPDSEANAPIELDDQDAETAFRLDLDRPQDGDNPDTAEDVLTSLSMDGPETLDAPAEDDTLPLNDESIIFRTASGERTDASFGRAAGATGAEAPHIAAGTTTCPTCGRETDALRFCGHCGASLTERMQTLTAETPLGRLQERATQLLDPAAAWTRLPLVRLILGAGAVLVLLALLANSGGLALIIGAAILPLILVYAFTRLDVFEAEPPLTIAGLGLAGTLVGAILGWLGAWVVESNWFDTGILNYGAAGFGGRFAEAASSAPVVVWAVNGLLLPLAAIAAIVGIPLALRQAMTLRNEIMDGLTLGGAVAGGISLGSAMVFAAPMLAGGGPESDASTWTLTTIGLTILRPLVWTLGGAMLGAAAWRYMRTQSIGGIIVPVAGAVGALLLSTLVALQLASAGLWPEVLWGLVVAIAVVVLYRMTLRAAIAEDRRVLGADDARQVCPNCHRVTPKGAYCAYCGTPLVGPAG